MSAVDFQLEPSQPLKYHALARIRSAIVSGRLPVGTRLPSVQALAKRWKSSVFTVQEVMSTLASEGLISRRPRVGTVVTARCPTLRSLGIYCDGQALSHPEECGFALATLAALRNRLDERGVQSTLWIDPRPEDEQIDVWPALKRAIDQQQMQGLLAPLINSKDTVWLGKLNLPVSVQTMAGTMARVQHGVGDAIVAGAQQLLGRGCRRVAVISTIPRPRPDDRGESEGQGVYRLLEQPPQGLEVRPEWVRTPERYLADKEGWGYRQLKDLWAMKDRPDGIIVFPDMAVRGVILATTELRIDVPRELKFVLHRNVEFKLICPFQADWMVSSAAANADAMLLQIERQVGGAAAEPIVLPLQFEDGYSQPPKTDTGAP